MRDAGFSTFPKLVLGRIEADFLQLKGHVAAFFKLNSRSYRAKKVQAFFFFRRTEHLALDLARAP